MSEKAITAFVAFETSENKHQSLLDMQFRYIMEAVDTWSGLGYHHVWIEADDIQPEVWKALLELGYDLEHNLSRHHTKVFWGNANHPKRLIAYHGEKQCGCFDSSNGKFHIICEKHQGKEDAQEKV